jgi:pimeloyl-ACP methyl ester carboxylesterase
MTVGGTDVFVRDLGDGPPLVLINGIGAHIEMWKPLERALPGLRIVSFDAPGTGRSPTQFLPSTIYGLARLVDRLFDEVGLANADVLGYSFGGAVAQQFAIQFPGRVRRLVLGATVPGWGSVPGGWRPFLAMATPMRYYSRRFYERTAGTIAGGRARHDRPYVRGLWKDRAGYVPSFTGYAQQMWALSTWTSLPWLDRIQAPTLVVVGDDDPLVPLSNALIMAARIPNARLYVGEHEGHFQLLDEHSGAVGAIREFLTAANLDDAPAWRSALRIDQAHVDHQIRSDGLGGLPWGAASALFRMMLR